MRTLIFALSLAGLAAPALAAPPEVVTDIPPVQSLVAQVMGDLGTPGLLLPPGGSPHGHQMRPSEARALHEAQLLFWIGPEQSPWLGDAAADIGSSLTSVPLLAVPGTVVRTARAHDHHDHDHDHDHDEDGHEEGHDEHEEEHTSDDGHVHEGIDPHAWLDPENAMTWLPEIARQLAVADPSNADTYRSNAEAAMTRVDELRARIAAELSGVTGGYIFYHDAYGYFTGRFGLPSGEAVTDGDAAPPGARRMAELQAGGDPHGCLFTEPQFDPRSAQRLAESLGVTVGVLDPVGSTLEPGPDLYGTLLQGIADQLAKCGS